MGTPAWTITITFTPSGEFRLHADAQLSAGLDHLTGHGDTRKHPSDPHVPEVAAAVAAARALTDLAEQLQEFAADHIEDWNRPGVILLPVIRRATPPEQSEWRFEPVASAAGTLVPQGSALRYER